MPEADTAPTLYDVRLKLDYEYETVVVGGRHLLRVMPVSLDDIQRVVAASLSVKPRPAERWDGTDFYHNHTTTVVYRGPHTELELMMTARVSVERDPRWHPGTALADLPAAIAKVRAITPDAPHHFLGSSRRIPLADALTGYGRAAASDAQTVGEAAWNLCRAIHRDFKYVPGATDVGTLPLDAFQQKSGVCQDFAHIMIAALRGMGIPAGYVSGFIRTEPPPGKPRLEGADAMHAWVRVWCGPQIGWQEFDPTNAIPAGRDHIVIGYGGDYDDVAPIIGVLRSSGGQKTKQAVDVVPLAQ